MPGNLAKEFDWSRTPIDSVLAGPDPVKSRHRTAPGTHDALHGRVPAFRTPAHVRPNVGDVRRSPRWWRWRAPVARSRYRARPTPPRRRRRPTRRPSHTDTTYPEPEDILGAPGEASEPNADLAPKGVDVSTLLDPPAPAALDDPSRPIDPKAGIMNLDHLIFIVLENRSFDHYFGTFPGADGIPMDANGSADGVLARPDPARRVPHALPRHELHRSGRPARDRRLDHGHQRREDGRVRDCPAPDRERLHEASRHPALPAGDERPAGPARRHGLSHGR